MSKFDEEGGGKDLGGVGGKRRICLKYSVWKMLNLKRIVEL